MSVAHTNVEQGVRLAVAESLGRELDEVQLGNLLIDDLGADSLDLLDIVFHLERAFDIEITRGQIEAAAKGGMSDDDFAPKGEISPAGLARLRELLPDAAERIVAGLRPTQIPGLFSVGTLVNIVNAKLRGDLE